MSNVRRGRQVERHLITLIRLLRRHGHCRHQFHGRINDPTDLALTPSVLRRHDFGQNVLLQEARDPRERAAGELEVIRRNANRPANVRLLGQIGNIVSDAPSSR